MRKETELASIASTITLKIVYDLLFKFSNDATISKDYFINAFSDDVFNRVVVALAFATKVFNNGMKSTVAAHIGLMALNSMTEEQLDDIIKNGISPDQIHVIPISKSSIDASEHDCNNCIISGECPIEDTVRNMKDIDDDKSIVADKPAKESEEKSEFVINCNGKFDINVEEN